jgi:uncharacterized protein with HEPN domain/predicted nucleotidyltransferase
MPAPPAADVERALRDELPHLRRRYRVDRLGLCGSFARGDQTGGSDVDLLVTFTENPSLYGLSRLQPHLEGMPGALKEGPAADNIRREVQYLDDRPAPPAPPPQHPPTVRSQRQYLLDILDAMEDAEDFVEGMTFGDVEGDLRTQYALQRAFEIIGEATKQLSEDIRERYPEVPRGDMAGMRDRLAHQYFAAQLDVAWEAIRDDSPQDKKHLRRILDDLPPDA